MAYDMDLFLAAVAHLAPALQRDALIGMAYRAGYQQTVVSSLSFGPTPLTAACALEVLRSLDHGLYEALLRVAAEDKEVATLDTRPSDAIYQELRTARQQMIRAHFRHQQASDGQTQAALEQASQQFACARQRFTDALAAEDGGEGDGIVYVDDQPPQADLADK